VTLIGWALAGPVDRLDEVVATAWWNALLDDRRLTPVLGVSVRIASWTPKRVDLVVFGLVSAGHLPPLEAALSQGSVAERVPSNSIYDLEE
jgi:hypothetical protein